MVGFLAAPAAALATDFTIDPPDPVMGEAVCYMAVDDGLYPSPDTYKWEYKYATTSCGQDWIDSGYTAYEAGFIESRPGSWDVRLTVTYPLDSSGMQHAPTVITKNVTIAPATKFTTIEGLNTSTPMATSIVLKYRVEAAARACGPYVSYNLAQEKITNSWQLSPPYGVEYPPDSDWVPDAADPDFQFQPSTNEIWDTHQQNTVVWGALPVDPDNPYMRDQQWLRIKYVDPCGQTKYLDVGSHLLKRFKVDANNWKITEVR